MAGDERVVLTDERSLSGSRMDAGTTSVITCQEPGEESSGVDI